MKAARESFCSEQLDASCASFLTLIYTWQPIRYCLNHVNLNALRCSQPIRHFQESSPLLSSNQRWARAAGVANLWSFRIKAIRVVTPYIENGWRWFQTVGSPRSPSLDSQISVFRSRHYSKHRRSEMLNRKSCRSSPVSGPNLLLAEDRATQSRGHCAQELKPQGVRLFPECSFNCSTLNRGRFAARI